MALSDVKCRNARPASKLVKLSDGGALQLWVQPTGSRLWRLAYRFDGKQKLLALGGYPLVSLAEARQARDDAKRLLLAGIDPGKERSLRKADSAKDSFRSIADEYVEKLKKEGRADRTISKVKMAPRLCLSDNRRQVHSGNRSGHHPYCLRRVEVRGRYESAGDYAPPSVPCFDMQSRLRAPRQIRRSL